MSAVNVKATITLQMNQGYMGIPNMVACVCVWGGGRGERGREREIVQVCVYAYSNQ